MSSNGKKKNMKSPEAGKNNKGNIIKLPKKTIENKILLGSVVKRSKINSIELKKKRKSLIKRDYGRRISFVDQPEAITEYDESKTEGNKLNYSNRTVTEIDQNMNILTKNKDKNIDILFGHSSKNNDSDRSSLFNGPQKYKDKNFNVSDDKKLKPKIRSSTPNNNKYVKRNSSSSFLKSQKLKNSLRISPVNKINNKILSKRKQKMNRVKEGRVSKTNIILSSPQRIRTSTYSSKSMKKIYIDIPEIFKEDIIEIRKKQEVLKRRYPLRVRKPVCKYLYDY